MLSDGSLNLISLIITFWDTLPLRPPLLPSFLILENILVYQMVALTGKIVVVTGASRGIGLEVSAILHFYKSVDLDPRLT
jgi:hypothetical protein